MAKKRIQTKKTNDSSKTVKKAKKNDQVNEIIEEKTAIIDQKLTKDLIEDNIKEEDPKLIENLESYLNELPSQSAFETSIVQTSKVCEVLFSSTQGSASGFLISITTDSEVQFWKKKYGSVEFVRKYRAHYSPFIAACLSYDGSLLATAAHDKTIKIFDVANFDMINLINLPFVPLSLSFIFSKNDPVAKLIVSDSLSSDIAVYDAKGDSNNFEILKGFHKLPISLLAYNARTDSVVSIDVGGAIEYWQIDSLIKGTVVFPKYPQQILFEHKFSTDLYVFKKSKTPPTSLVFSPDFKYFVTYGFTDNIIRMFDFSTGKIIFSIDESVNSVTKLRTKKQQEFSNKFQLSLDGMDFDRRCAIEETTSSRSIGQLQYIADQAYLAEKGDKLKLEKLNETPKQEQLLVQRPCFDDRGRTLIYPSMTGIKIVSAKTGILHKVIGSAESDRYLRCSLFQDVPEGSTISAINTDGSISNNPLLEASRHGSDPTLACTALNRERVFLFTRRLPSENEDRDVFAK